MIYNVGDRMVEICDELFPAVNIQVWDCYPDLHWHEEHNCWYGLYFDMIFENGVSVSVEQEMRAHVVEGRALCNPQTDNVELMTHFLVEVRSRNDGYQKSLYSYHCTSETNLLLVLRDERGINNLPSSLFLKDLASV